MKCWSVMCFRNVCLSVCVSHPCVSMIHPRHPDSQSVHRWQHLYTHIHLSCSGKHPSCNLTNTIIHIVKDGTYRVIKSIYVCVFGLPLQHISSLLSPQSSIPLQVWFRDTHFVFAHVKPHSETHVTILEKYSKIQETTSQIVPWS